MFEWYFKKKKNKNPSPPKKKQILVLFYGDLWKSWNLQPIFLPPRQNGDARCHCQDPVCESLFGLPSCALQKKAARMYVKARRETRAGTRLEKGDVGKSAFALTVQGTTDFSTTVRGR